MQLLYSQTEIYLVQNCSLEMPYEPFSGPQPQHWIKFLDPWVHDLYPVLGWGLATSWGEHNSPQHPHWIKIGLPFTRIQNVEMLISSCLLTCPLPWVPLVRSSKPAAARSSSCMNMIAYADFSSGHKMRSRSSKTTHNICSHCWAARVTK